MASKPKEPSMPSVWARPEPTTRQPALNRALIVREAVALLDEEGAAELSMRKLGARMNAGATSFSRHVGPKDHLMELAVDHVLGEVTGPLTGPGNWRADITAFAESFRATALRHPWLCAELGRAGLAYLGPNLSALSAHLLTVLGAAGHPDPHGAVDVLYSYVIGMSTTEAAWLTTVARTGLTEAEFLARTLPDTPDEEAEKPGSALDPAAIRDGKFTAALDIVLDGIATRITP
ncbi:TetR/AcrR family transcriptional regulator [Streptomyces erythrochromogenes]|uniref:TetR/AcrR family transcriptional regulator n=1 Tax=Streptomyces erythrochromogenes TaxID=285574 RepID=UPI00368834DB